MYVSDTEGWPKHMHLKFEHFEHEMPFNRCDMHAARHGGMEEQTGKEEKRMGKAARA